MSMFSTATRKGNWSVSPNSLDKRWNALVETKQTDYNVEMKAMQGLPWVTILTAIRGINITDGRYCCSQSQ